MSNIDNNIIMKEIEINKEHIENFVLETTEGTKRTKEKFYKNAVMQRNDYVNKQQIIFDKYKVLLENEMAERIKKLMPKDKTKVYEKESLEVDNLLDLIKLNSNISNSFKLKLDFIIASINEETSLESLNIIVEKFIDRFAEFGLELTIDDFKYTMFTEEYMSSFFKSSDYDLLKDTFEKIYFACPEIKLQLKMNLINIISKYDKELDKYVCRLKDEKLKEYDIISKNVIDKYISYRYVLGNKMATDEYYNIKEFLDKKRNISDYLNNSPARSKNYNSLVISGDYEKLNDEEKATYNSAVMNLYLTLNELKKYYSYEFILLDLFERYKEKDNIKNQYTTKKKEIDKEEKNRLHIYKEFLKASGVGFLAKKDEIKMKKSMLKMNEHIKKLDGLYTEFRDLEITNCLSKLNDSSSLYDLFLIALSSFSFLEKSFTNNDQFANQSLDDIINNYFKYLYNPNNNILRKISAFAQYDIVSIIAEKYKLLNLNITSEMINKDSIDSTMDTVKFINLIQNIERSNITVDKINNICKMSDIISVHDTDQIV